MAIFDNPTNLTRVNEIFSTADTFAGGNLGKLIFILVGFGTFLLTGQFNSRESFIATSFVMLIVSLLLKYGLGLLGDFYVWASAIFFILALFAGLSSKTPTGA